MYEYIHIRYPHKIIFKMIYNTSYFNISTENCENKNIKITTSNFSYHTFTYRQMISNTDCSI